MTFDDYRQFGYVSKLGMIRCGSGPGQDLVNNQKSYANSQNAIAGQEDQNAQEDRAQGKQLQNPLIEKELALASGDRKAAVQASMPTISKLSEGFAGAKQSIFNSLPAGAARDKAIAGLEIQKDTGIASAEANEVNKAPEILANIGSGLGAFSLQELGASLSGYGGASSANQGAGNMQMQQSEAKWGPIVGLAQAAGGAAGAFKKSDRRLKSNIRPMEGLLLRTRKVPTVTFRYNADPERPQIGVIAQDLLAAQFPEAVRLDEYTGMYMVDYGMIAAIALGAVRELAEKVERQQDQINSLTLRKLTNA